MVDSSDSNSGHFEIRQNSKPMKRKHNINEDDGEEEISGREAMLRRRKQPKKSKSPFLYTPPTSKMIWTKNDELVILKGIVEYEKEKGFSYGSDSDLLYGYVKGMIDADFSKTQLMNKVRKLKKRFRDIVARSKDETRLSFVSTDEEEVFRLLRNIWGKNQTECDSDEDMQDQDQQPKEVHVSVKDVSCTDHEPTRMERENKSEEEDDFCVLQEALEGVTEFQTFGKNQQKMICRNLKKLPAQRKKELADEWKAFLDEEMKFNIKKLTFAAKLANA